MAYVRLGLQVNGYGLRSADADEAPYVRLFFLVLAHDVYCLLQSCYLARTSAKLQRMAGSLATQLSGYPVAPRSQTFLACVL